MRVGLDSLATLDRSNCNVTERRLCSSNARFASIEFPSEWKHAGKVLQAKKIKQTSLADDCLGKLIMFSIQTRSLGPFLESSSAQKCPLPYTAIGLSRWRSWHLREALKVFSAEADKRSG